MNGGNKCTNRGYNDKFEHIFLSLVEMDKVYSKSKF